MEELSGELYKEIADPRGPGANGSPPAEQVDWGVEVRTVLLTFLALFLVLAFLLAVIVWAIPAYPHYAGLLGLLGLPVVLVIGLALGVRLYLHRAPFSDGTST